MRELKAERRLVKSPPELWSQCSEPTALARHLTRFGEIRISRLEDEHTVAWEGDRIRGTVELEASGWGTRVRFTAAMPDPAPPAPSSAAPRSSPPASTGLASIRRRIVDLIRARVGRPRLTTATPTPAAASAVFAPEPAPVPEILAGLEAALDSLAVAHHRPYSRS